MSIKDMIARCIERMRGGACATCDNRRICPAGRWQAAFAVEGAAKAGSGAGFLAFVSQIARSIAPAKQRCFRAEVEGMIEPMLEQGVSIDIVARQIGISRQTMYRRLKSEGVTFEDVLETKRKQLAVRYLGLDRMPVKVAAYKLGFSDPAAFSRAFKRWTGVSPSLFRTA